jgi:hypothetical protein
MPDSASSVETGHFLFEHSRRTSSPQATSMCACAETMPERVLTLLELCARYDLEDVYSAFLDVAANMRTDDLSVCSR